MFSGLHPLHVRSVGVAACLLDPVPAWSPASQSPTR